MRTAEEYEVTAYRNLAKNVMDQHGDHGCYPHAYANVETRGESVFAARNAIDGVLANASHGAWPYESWGINMQDDAELTLEFGRPVDFDKIVLYTGENEKLNGIIKKNAESIKHDVLADEIVYSLGGDSSKEWNINGEKMTLGVSKK